MKFNEFAKARLGLLLIKIIFILIAIGFTCWFLIFCRVKNVEVVGNQLSNPDEIVQSANIKINSQIYSINEKAIENKIIADNAFVKSVEIRKYLPSTIRINIEENKPLYYSFNNDNYYILSSDLRILKISKQLSTQEKNYTEIILPTFVQNEVGKYITYDNTNLNDSLKEVLTPLSKSPILSKIKTLNLATRFDITAIYDGYYTIVFGDYHDFSKKLTNCIKTIEYLQANKPNSKGIIYSYTAIETSFEENK